MDKELKNILAARRNGEDVENRLHEYLGKKAVEYPATIDLKENDILKVLNGAYIAKRFFGRSSCWFSQKLNGHIKNGKPCEFLEDERKQLADALETVAWEILDLAESMR